MIALNGTVEGDAGLADAPLADETLADAALLADAGLVDRVRSAVRSVDDPEYPDVSIVDLGLVESIDVCEGTEGAVARVGLIPTFSGCPALAMIADDVRRAVEAVVEVASCDVQWLPAPVWTPDRLSPRARATLATDYTVVVWRNDVPLRCPVCASSGLEMKSLAGPTRCRAVAWCSSCRNPVEVMR